MISVLVGAVSALLWGAAGLVNGRLSRLAGTPRTVAWSMLTGVVICTALAASRGWPTHATTADWVWATSATAGTIAGLLLSYESYRRGRLGVVAPIVATQGAIAAVLSVLAGESLEFAAVPVLAALVVGIAMAAAGGPAGRVDQPAGRDGLVAPLLALVSAGSFAFGLFATAQVGDELHPFWVAWIPRAIGVAAVVVPVAAVVGMRLARPTWRFAAVGGALEVGGLVAFVVAARDNAAVASVVSSQFAIVTALGAFLLWGEGLRRLQLVGVGVVLVGVALLAVIQS